MFIRLIFVLCLLSKQNQAVRDVTYTAIYNRITGKVLNQRSMVSEEMCLNICYDHELCSYAHYSENNCTIYKKGSVTYLPGEIDEINEITYKLNRTLRLPSCAREVVLRPTVEFEPIEVQPDTRVNCSALPSKVTCIHMYSSNGPTYPIYSTSDLMGNYTELQRMYFASEPQSQCVSVPVFTGDSYSRLYFGHVYNVSGYNFINAYAFTGVCACETNACCGNITIDEYLRPFRGAKQVYGYVYLDPNKWSADFSGAAISTQQFYIAGIEYLSTWH